MIKKTILLLTVAFLPALLFAQVTLSVQMAPSGVIQKNQLWNLVLVNTSDNVMQVTIHLSVSAANDNTPVMTAISRPVFLTKGARQVTAKDAGPVQYNYYSSLFTDRNPDGFLPAGNYIACYVIYSGQNTREVPLAEDCVPVEVSPIAPPLLNMPEDEGVLETQYPQFSWLPPAPLQLFGNLTYDLLLVEVLKGQSSTEAIQQNMPLYFAGNLRSVFNNYPASNKALDTTKTYAWRIVAKNAGQYAGQSEVWTFRIHKPQQENIVPRNGHYILLKKGQTSGVNNIDENVLGIKYYSFDKTHEVTIRFFDTKGSLIRSVTKELAYGDNYLAFSLEKQFEKEQVYTIELTDSHGNKHMAFFRMQP